MNWEYICQIKSYNKHSEVLLCFTAPDKHQQEAAALDTLGADIQEMPIDVQTMANCTLKELWSVS